MFKAQIRTALERFPALAQFLRNCRDLMDRRAPPLPTPWGFTLAGNPAMSSGSFEPEETRVVRELLRDVDILVNVGANVGYYCCHALSLGKPVIAVEPLARNLWYLLKNLRDNGWADAAQVFPVAAGRDADVLEMWGGDTGASLVKGWAGIPESYVTLVPVLGLDRIVGDALAGKRALILVDVEGAESMLLEGAGHLLRHEPRPIWMMEITTGENQPGGESMNPAYASTFETFFGLGYRAYYANAQRSEVHADLVAEIQAGRVKPATHNYLFR